MGTIWVPHSWYMSLVKPVKHGHHPHRPHLDSVSTSAAILAGLVSHRFLDGFPMVFSKFWGFLFKKKNLNLNEQSNDFFYPVYCLIRDSEDSRNGLRNWLCDYDNPNILGGIMPPIIIDQQGFWTLLIWPILVQRFTPFMTFDSIGLKRATNKQIAKVSHCILGWYPQSHPSEAAQKALHKLASYPAPLDAPRNKCCTVLAKPTIIFAIKHVPMTVWHVESRKCIEMLN